MTTDQDNLLAAVLANPDDDLPRLVYCDWLEESGEVERAEFIRVQVELANLDAKFPDRECKHMDYSVNDDIGWKNAGGEALRQREWELVAFADAVGGWFETAGLPAYLPGAAMRNEPHCLVERGFVSTVSAPLAVLVGGECERCGGQGYLHNDMHYSNDPCPARCKDGRTPGIAADLIRTQPVTRWVDPTRKPLQRGEHDYEYGWTSDDFGQTSGAWALPERVFDLLGSGKKWFDWKVYDSEADALAALSDAVATIAKQQGVK